MKVGGFCGINAERFWPILMAHLVFLYGCNGSSAWDVPLRDRLEPFVFESASGDRVNAELGSFHVPENRRSGGKKSIQLWFVRFPSTNPNPGPPIVYLAGGPGGSGINAARFSRFPLFMALREAGDVIAFDQRGTGRSSLEHEDCALTMERPAAGPLGHGALIQMELKAAETCGEYWRDRGIDLTAYNTLESADDIESLRRVLGVEKLNLWAISYGTHLALAAIRRHPDRIDRAILAGVEGPDHTVKLPSHSEQQLKNLQKLIDTQPQMRLRYPHFRQKVRETLEWLDHHSIRIEYTPSDGGPATSVVVGRPELERITISMLRDPTTMIALPSFYERLTQGHFSGLASSPEVAFEMEAMAEAMDAASGMSVERRRQFLREAQETTLGGGTILAGAELAGALGIPDLGEEFRSPVTSSIPALFISGTLDGRTPVANAVEVLKGFPNGTHLVLENAGHSNDLFLSSPKILGIMAAFFKGSEMASQTLTVAPPDFATVRQPVSLDPTKAVRYLGEYQAEGEVWQVISLGTYRFQNEGGTTEDMRIQIRHGGNGFSILPVSQSEFFIPLTGWEQTTYVFSMNTDGNVSGLEYHDREGRLVRLPKLK